MPFSEGRLDIFYRPVVDPRDEQVMIYRAVPVLTAEDGTAKVGAKQVLKHHGKPTDPAVTINTAERNVAVLQRAAADLVAAHSAGRAVFLMMPFNAKSLGTRKSATIMVNALKQMHPLCAKAFISHLFDLPDRVTLDVLDTVVVPLLVSIDKFVIEPPAGLKDYADIGACNAQGVVLDMDPDEGTGLDLTTLWSRAAPRHLGIFAQNVTDEAVISDLLRYEGRGVDGPILGKLLPEIGPRTSRGSLASLETVS